VHCLTDVLPELLLSTNSCPVKKMGCGLTYFCAV